MNINKKNLTIGVLGAALLTTSGITAVDAAQGEEYQKKEFQHTPEMKKIVENSNYEILPETLAEINETDSHQFADMIALKQAGDKKVAKKSKQKDRNNEKHFGGMHEYLLEGNFEKWAEEAEEHDINPSMLTQDNFFNEMKAAVESDDRNAFKAVHEAFDIDSMHRRDQHDEQRSKTILELSYEE